MQNGINQFNDEPVVDPSSSMRVSSEKSESEKSESESDNCKTSSTVNIWSEPEKIEVFWQIKTFLIYFKIVNFDNFKHTT